MNGSGLRLTSLMKVGSLAFLASLLWGHLSWAQKVEIKNENGVTIIHNPKTPVPPPGTPSRVILKEDLVIGNEREKDDYWFSFVNSIAVDESGNIYAMDPKEIRIRVFDTNGKLLRAFGRKGQGPGEFSGPSLVEVRPDGTILVVDVLNHRLSYLTRDGESLKDVPLRFSGQSIIKSDAKGDIYCLRFKFEEDKQTQEILKCDPSLQPVRKIASFEWPYKRRVVNPYPEGLLACVMKDDDLIWGMSSSYEMNIVDPNGKALRRIVKDYDPVKITAADKKTLLEKESSRSGPLRFEYEFPEHYPAFNLLLVDDLNRVYVRTYEKDGQGLIAHDVFSPEGRYVARFFLPENERATIVKKNKLYCMIRESEEGIPLIKRYAIEWE